MKAESRTVYSAPALEKGLDILELLAAEAHPMTARQIGDRLGRSKNEIFRMVQVLVERGYLMRDAATDQLSLSNRLFELGMRTPRSRTLAEAALPAMQRLATSVGHAVHLVVVSAGRTVVIANAAPPWTAFNFLLQPGYGQPATGSSSGQTIIAFRPPEERHAMIRETAPIHQAGPQGNELELILERIGREGSVIAPSNTLAGVIDICAPILDRTGKAVASVVVPCLRKLGPEEDYEAIRQQLVGACTDISTSLF